MPTQKSCSASETAFITAFWQLYQKEPTEKNHPRVNGAVN